MHLFIVCFLQSFIGCYYNRHLFWTVQWVDVRSRQYYLHCSNYFNRHLSLLNYAIIASAIGGLFHLVCRFSLNFQSYFRVCWASSFCSSISFLATYNVVNCDDKEKLVRRHCQKIDEEKWNTTDQMKRVAWMHSQLVSLSRNHHWPNVWFFKIWKHSAVSTKSMDYVCQVLNQRSWNFYLWKRTD